MLKNEVVGNYFCMLENTLLDFTKFKNITKVSIRGISINTKIFESNFMSTDCHDNKSIKDVVDANLPDPYYDLYSTQLSGQHCDYVIEEPVLLFSHDYLINLGNTINDQMKSKFSKSSRDDCCIRFHRRVDKKCA